MRIPKETVEIRFPDHTFEEIDLQNRIITFLHQQDVPNAGRIRAEAHGGTVVISGQVPSRHAKWLCVECCHRVAGVVKLVDNVGIKPDLIQSISQSEFPHKAAA